MQEPAVQWAESDNGRLLLTELQDDLEPHTQRTPETHL